MTLMKMITRFRPTMQAHLQTSLSLRTDQILQKILHGQHKEKLLKMPLRTTVKKENKKHDPPTKAKKTCG